MNLLLKWTLLFAALMMLMDPNHAWNIGAKGRVTGPTIHTTYFLTPNNTAFDVQARAYIGFWANGTCQYNYQYTLGTDSLRTGDFVDIDAFQLKSIVGGGYNCITIFYTYRQPVMETFQLIWDGINYIGSLPPTSEVTIL